MKRKTKTAKTPTKAQQDRIDYAKRLAEFQAKIYGVVKPLVDKYDVEQLLSMGCPKDEYDPISQRITDGICMNGGKPSETGLAHIIALQFHYSFGQWSKPVSYFSVYFKMAEELLPLLPNAAQPIPN